MIKPKPTLWSDEDGVIAVYERHAYQSQTNQPPLWLQPSVHYYKQLQPDERIIEAYRQLQTSHRLPVTVLTNITTQYPVYLEHWMDKKEWTQEHMPFLDVSKQFFAIQIPKCEFARRKLHRQLEPTDILISDYNNDLIPWQKAGGTAVKYLNGLNSQDSFPGPSIPTNWNPDAIRDYILSLYPIY